MKERFKYDPWGRPREYMEWLTMSDTTWHSIDRHLQATNKGFTGHEMLDEVGIIHMGGRIYEPTIGRFLSADPVVKGLHNPESYNRYSYVLNSPLSFTDPSGYSWWSEHVTDELRNVREHWRELLVLLPPIAIIEATLRYAGRELARFAARNKYAGEVIGLVGIGGCAFITGGTGAAGCLSAYQGGTTASISYASGAPIEKALGAGLQSAALAYSNAAVANSIGNANFGIVGSGFAHGMRGAFFAGMAGGDVRSGFVGGLTEGVLGSTIRGWAGDSATSGTVAAAFISGSVSEVTGGKFATGAVTGAMGYLFNAAAHAAKARRPGKVYLTGHRVGEVGPIHTAIEYDGGNGAHWVSAGPEGYGADGFESLVGGVGNALNGIRPTDAPAFNITLGTVAPPAGMSAGQYFQRLSTAASSYSNNVDYDLFPTISNGYNSNSYVSGLIRATGGRPSVPMSNFVGGEKPLPKHYFGY